MNASTSLSSPMISSIPPVKGDFAPPLKALWMAIACLAVCMLAIGGTLIRQQPSAAASIVPLTAAQAMLAESKDVSPVTASHAMPAKKSVAASPATAPSKASAQVTPTSAEAIARRSAQAPATSDEPSNAPAFTCANCGTVEAVTAVTRQGQASGVGVVGGAVVGGLLGNQVGKGNGRAAATVLGAVGGGWAGNTIEKNMKKTTAYSVRVRMQDGTSRTVEQSTAPMVGSKVMLEGSAIKPA